MLLAHSQTRDSSLFTFHQMYRFYQVRFVHASQLAASLALRCLLLTTSALYFAAFSNPCSPKLDESPVHALGVFPLSLVRLISHASEKPVPYLIPSHFSGALVDSTECRQPGRGWAVLEPENRKAFSRSIVMTIRSNVGSSSCRSAVPSFSDHR